MVNYDILKGHGTTRERMRSLFSQFDPGNLEAESAYLLHEKIREFRSQNNKEPDIKRKNRWQREISKRLFERRTDWTKEISGNIQEGRNKFCAQYKHYMVCDLAWDNPSESLPLSMLASGKLKITNLSQITELEKETGVNIFETDSDGVKKLNVPRLYEAHVSFIRPTVTRLVAEQSEKHNSLYPFLKYDPRSRSNPVERLRADVMSQRAELVVDAHGYRPLNTQLLREHFLYGSVVAFVSSGWKIEKAELNEGESPSVTREGFRLIHPHPTRIFYDDAYPLSSLNYDNGLNWIGYWQAVRSHEITENPDYWNRKRIPFRTGLSSSIASLPGLDYINPEAMKLAGVNAENLAQNDGLRQMFEQNDRQSLLGFYAAETRNSPLVKTEYFQKIIPLQKGLGTYNHPVWVRLTVANDEIVINGEILPSRPGAAMSYNVNDSRIKNPSLVHDMLPYEDQIKQQLSQVLWLMKLQSMVLIGINTDIIHDKDMRNSIRKHIEGGKYLDMVGTLEFSLQHLMDVLGKSSGRDILKPLQEFVVNVGTEINSLFNSIAFLSSMMEKNLMISPQQQAQLVTKETNATEIASVDRTTSILSNYFSSGPDEFWAAVKVILYESLVALGSKDVEVPVVESYPEDVMQRAGFTRTDGRNGNLEPGATVRGSTRNLVANYVFTSRDRNERPIDSETAVGLMQMVQTIVSSDIFLRAVGIKQVTEALTEAFRMAGSTFKFEIQEGEDPALQNEELLQQLVQAVRELQENDAQFEEALTTINDALKELAPRPAPQPA